MEPTLGTGLAVKAVEVIVPKGIDFLYNKLVGKKILICGMGRAGKTSFQNYLMRGNMIRERPTSKTREIEKLGNAKVRLNSRNTYDLRISVSRDTPGQLGTIEQANTVIQFVPDILFVFLDCSRIAESLEWLTDYCECLDPRFRMHPQIAKNVRSIFYVLNKWDKIIPANGITINDIYSDFSRKVNDIIVELLEHSYYHLTIQNRIPLIFPAICVKTQHGTEYTDEIINNIAINI